MTAPVKQKFNLEGYRAVAALVVIIFHAYQHNRYGPNWTWPLEGSLWHDVLMNTDMLVDMFFILSGFLLGLPYAKAVLGVGKPRPARAFLLRRAVRLIPLYVIAVLVVWSISNPMLPGDWPDLLLHLTFTHVWSDEKIFYTNGPAWTLGVEAHFYLLLAALGFLGQRYLAGAKPRTRIAVVLAVLFGLIAASLGYKFWAVYVREFPVEGWSIWFNPAAKLDILATGLLLAVACAAGVRWPNAAVRTLVGLTGGAVVAAGVWLRYAHMPDAFSHTFFGVGIMLVISATALSLGQGPFWLRWAPMVSLSMVSYSLYLWHEPLLRLIDSAGLLPAPVGHPSSFLLTAALLVGASVPVAYLSYWMIEVPAQRIMGAFDADGRARVYYAPLPDPRSA